jgi:hypothetical protein
MELLLNVALEYKTLPRRVVSRPQHGVASNPTTAWLARYSMKRERYYKDKPQPHTLFIRDLLN